MEFLQEIGKKITSVGQDVATQTAKMADVARLNNEISASEKEMNQYLILLGKEYYMTQRENSDLEEVEKVTELRKKIHSLKKSLRDIKGTAKCKKCGAEVHIEFAFCQSCGEAMPTASQEEQGT